MAVDSTRFRAAMAQFATGVTIVTTRDEAGHRFGLTVNAFASVSLDPPLVLVCIDNRSDAHKGFQASGVFGISVLAEGQEDWSRRFATPGPEKWSGGAFETGATGVALIPGALAHVECRVAAAHPAGDHTIYVGQVERLAVGSGTAPPLSLQRLRPRRRTSGGRMTSGTVPFEFPERFNMAWYFLDRNVEEGRGDKVCLYYRDEAYTYGEVQAQANRFANALAALGVQVEDRVLLVLPDRPEFVFAWFGAAKAGAVIAMVNPALPAEDYVHYFQYTRCRVAVVDESVLPKIDPLRDSFPHLRHLIVVGEPGTPRVLRGGLRRGVRPVRRTPTRTATTPRSGSSRAARRASPRRPSTSSRTSRGTPSATRSRSSESARTTSRSRSPSSSSATPPEPTCSFRSPSAPPRPSSASAARPRRSSTSSSGTSPRSSRRSPR